MAGGRGERLWPQSCLQRPKHLLPIVEDKPLLTETIKRLGGLIGPDNIFVITNQQQYTATLAACTELPTENVIAEPIGRDTAAAVGLATILVKQKDPDGIFTVLPADHVIHDVDHFKAVINAAFEAAQDESLVTIGIKPTAPATGYGYIHKGEVLNTCERLSVYKVERFVEKPDLATAQKYLDSGEYYWNAGMFVWGVKAIEAAFSSYTPEVYGSLQTIEKSLQEGISLETVLKEEYPKIKKISIDYAIMEHAQNVVTLEASFDWDDIGEWPAVMRHNKKDNSGNVTRGEVVVESCKDSLVINEDDHLIALLGVEDLVVVKTPDATLICPKDRAQDIKTLVKTISDNPKYTNLL
tara:strand:- start:37525 stop:38586 length:1062 start_codon:yes stop_codon:yes gene_type:complete